MDVSYLALRQRDWGDCVLDAVPVLSVLTERRFTHSQLF
jgi:hypothetical protein